MTLGITPALLASLMIGPLAAPDVSSRSIATSEPASEGAPANARVVLLMPLAIEGKISKHARAEFDAQIRAGLSHESISIINATDSCSDDACMRDTARAQGADYAISIAVVSGGRDFRVDLRVLPVRDDRVNFETNIDCPVCGIDEAGIQLTGKARVLRDWVLADSAWARLQLSGTPAHAAVYVDGEWAGALPFSGELSVGDHEIVVRAPGYHDSRVPFTAIAGSAVELSVALSPKPVEADTADTADPPRWRAPVGGVMTGLGAIGLVAGATLVALHGRPIGSLCSDPAQIDADGDCKYQYTSAPAGVGSLLGGAALASVGVALLVIDVRRKTPTGQVIGLTFGLDHLQLEVQF